MAESTERFEGKTPEEMKEELKRLIQETLERDLQRAGNPKLLEWGKEIDRAKASRRELA